MSFRPTPAHPGTDGGLVVVHTGATTRLDGCVVGSLADAPGDFLPASVFRSGPGSTPTPALNGEDLR
jgi:hypothetical protein